MIRLFLAFILCGASAFAEETTINTIGTLFPNAQSKLGCPVSGRVQDVYVDIGKIVKKGDSLVLLDTSVYEIKLAQAAAMLETAKIELNDAETNFLRMKNLWEKPEGEHPSIPQKRFDDAKSLYEKAKVQLALAKENLKRAQLDLDEATIKAPFDGIITERFVDPGDAVTNLPVTDIVEIQAVQPLYLEFSLSQGHLNSIQVGTPIVFEVEGTGSTKYEAKIDLIYPSVDERTRSVKYRAVIDNSENRFRPGSLTKVEIKKS